MTKSDNGRQKTHSNGKRVLGDEWLDWDPQSCEENIDEGSRTFLLVSLAALAILIAAGALFWYLVIPRIESFGRIWAQTVTITLAIAAAGLLGWYVTLFIRVMTRRTYLDICFIRGRNLIFYLLPFTMKLASSLGISRDRLSHSFIKVSNVLVRPDTGSGPVLALFPRCLRKDIRSEIQDICGKYPDVIFNTAAGGTAARRIIRETHPRAIIAVACERDLMSGIRDVAPRIPVIGIPNSRPHGPCKDTTLDLEKFGSAVEFFCRTP
jgi:hypothetical protein